jgi:hypothetical protein
VEDADPLLGTASVYEFLQWKRAIAMTAPETQLHLLETARFQEMTESVSRLPLGNWKIEGDEDHVAARELAGTLNAQLQEVRPTCIGQRDEKLVADALCFDELRATGPANAFFKILPPVSLDDSVYAFAALIGVYIGKRAPNDIERKLIRCRLEDGQHDLFP